MRPEWRPVSVHQRRLWVPWDDWSAVTVGTKREFRSQLGHLAARPELFVTPEPAIGWSRRPFGENVYEHHMLIVEAAWTEPLGAISQESLEAEGFATLDEFRAYWVGRYRGARGFRPLSKIAVYRVRPWQDGDVEHFGRSILMRLYGDRL